MKEARVFFQLVLPAEIHEILEQMAEEIDGSLSDVMINAIALLNVALESKREGRRLMIVGDHDGIEKEVVGFDTVATS